MNCDSFKDQLMEFTDGSLPVQEHAAAAAHLTECESCREAMRQEERLAQVLSEGLHASVAGVELNHEAKRRIRARLTEKPKLWGEFFEGWQVRWAMGAAATALIVAGVYLVGGEDAREADPTMALKKTEMTLVQVAYQRPVRVFRREGNRVIDSLMMETVAVNELVSNK